MSDTRELLLTAFCFGHNPGDPQDLAVAIWECRNGNRLGLCQRHLDMWFDIADDDPGLEPAAVTWLPPLEVPHVSSREDQR